jgi:hypothetical protein
MTRDEEDRDHAGERVQPTSSARNSRLRENPVMSGERRSMSERPNQRAHAAWVARQPYLLRTTSW